MNEIHNIILSKFNRRFVGTVTIRPVTRCWIWLGDRDRKGYGRCYVENKRMQAHRISWQIYNGEILDGLSVLHKCDEPACVNPEHLYLGTQKDNVRDMWRKGRNAGQFVPQTHCKKGHEFNSKNTIIRGDNRKSCRICRIAWKRNWRLKKKGA